MQVPPGRAPGQRSYIHASASAPDVRRLYQTPPPSPAQAIAELLPARTPATLQTRGRPGALILPAKDVKRLKDGRATFEQAMQYTFGIPEEGPLTSFLTRRDGKLYFCDQPLDKLVATHGTPLRLVMLPQITRNIQAMQAAFAAAKEETGYPGDFVYAYPSKANYDRAVIQTALDAGVHYETSSTVDVLLAAEHGTVPKDRFVFAHGSKDEAYLDALEKLYECGNTNIVPVIDDLDELQEIQKRFPLEVKVGVRDRMAGMDGHHRGNDRFGLEPGEIDAAARRLKDEGRDLILYHGMVGFQIEEIETFVKELAPSLHRYAALRKTTPSLHIFDFGGGMATNALSLRFSFDPREFFKRLMETTRKICDAEGVPCPDIAGELGSYTVANHVATIFGVNKTKARDQRQDADWYILDGSLMVTAPDMQIGREFLILPLEGWNERLTEVRLGGGSTCDSGDFYPRGKRPMLAPKVGRGTPLHFAMFGLGAYQGILAGQGGAHHCLTREPKTLTFSSVDGKIVAQETPRQDIDQIAAMLGYPSRAAEGATIGCAAGRQAPPPSAPTRAAPGRGTIG